MPFFWLELGNILMYHEKHSLQVEPSLSSPSEGPGSKQERVSLCAPSGSMTVECALVLPLFFLVMVTLISLLDVFRIQALLTTSLCGSANELGMYAYADRKSGNHSPIGLCSTGTCIAYAKTKLTASLKNESLTGVKGGLHGIRLSASQYKDSEIILRAVYDYQFPFSPVPLPAAKVKCTGYARAWTGNQGESTGQTKAEPAEEMVYVTIHEAVYHVREDCSHLRLSVMKVDSRSIRKRRNQYKEKYYPCEKCVGKGVSAGNYYITEKGNRFHSFPSCSGLKRTVLLVKKSRTGSLKVCERCGEHGNK